MAVAWPLIFGEVLFDRFPGGEVVLGGAPFNVAWNLRALGLAPLLVSRVGRDELGDRILEAMQRWEMDTRGVQRDEAHATGTVEVTVEDGEPSFDIAADRAYDHITAEGVPALASGSLLYHGSLALRGESSAAALDALRGRMEGPVFMDVNLRAPWWEAGRVWSSMDRATWVKLNDHELAALAPEPGGIEVRTARLLEKGAMHGAVVTRGPEGVYFRKEDGTALRPDPVPAAEVVDTVGAGDAFSSVVILGLVREWPWPLILGRALEFAAAVVGLRGATTEERSFYRSFVEKWELS